MDYSRMYFNTIYAQHKLRLMMRKFNTGSNNNGNSDINRQQILEVQAIFIEMAIIKVLKVYLQIVQCQACLVLIEWGISQRIAVLNVSESENKAPSENSLLSPHETSNGQHLSSVITLECVKMREISVLFSLVRQYYYWYHMLLNMLQFLLLVVHKQRDYESKCVG